MSAAAGEGAVARVPVAHRLFTNAPGGDGGAGFRHRRVGSLPEGVRVESWLESLRPATDGGLAWAAAAFRLGGALHLAVARVDGAFRPDEHGRGRGHLAHALVAAAGEDEPDRDLAAGLVEAAQRLARPAGRPGDLETVVGGCASLEVVECRTTDRWWRQAAAVAAQRGGHGAAESPAAGLPAAAAVGESAPDGAAAVAALAAWLEPAVLAASAEDAGGAIEVAWPAADFASMASTTTASDAGPASAAAATAAASESAAGPSRTDGPGTAASAGTAAGAAAPSPTAAARAVAAACRPLPPRLRLALRWSVAARPLPDDRLRLSLAPASALPPPALAGPAAAYAEWLRDRLAAGDGAAVAAVAGDWRIRSWRHLVERLGAAVAR